MQRLRRTMMFVPGNNPGMMADAHIYGPDSIMLDLEDSVTMAEKDTAQTQPASRPQKSLNQCAAG